MDSLALLLALVCGLLAWLLGLGVLAAIVLGLVVFVAVALGARRL